MLFRPQGRDRIGEILAHATDGGFKPRFRHFAGAVQLRAQIAIRTPTCRASLCHAAVLTMNAIAGNVAVTAIWATISTVQTPPNLRPPLPAAV